MLGHYAHVEAIPDDSADWEVKPRGALRLATNLASSREEVALYKHLATLRRDVPLTEELDDLRWQGVNRAELAAFCKEIGDSSLEEQVSTWREDEPAPF